MILSHAALSCFIILTSIYRKIVTKYPNPVVNYNLTLGSNYMEVDSVYHSFHEAMRARVHNPRIHTHLYSQCSYGKMGDEEQESHGKQW